MMVRLNKRNEMIRFIVVGILATAIHYGIYFLFSLIINVTIAYSIGCIISFIANYILTTHFTFNVKPNTGNSVGFAICHAINWLLQLLLLNAFLYLGIHRSIAPFPTLAICVPINFFMIKFVMNRNKRHE